MRTRGRLGACIWVMLAAGHLQAAERFPVVEATIEQIHAAFREERLTCRQLVDVYLHRIATYDKSSRLNAILLVNPQARARADELDRLFARTGKLLPLHGIPVIVKDNFDTGDLPTTAGSRALATSRPPDDAFQVRRLRAAGAIVLAKSNMAEFAHSPLYTVSSLGGITRNPYDLSRVPAGSSGGTAAAVAANLGSVGLGTDTGNSIRGPASHTALVGLRPTLGLTSRDGIVPLSLRNDVGGPMCRSVADVARVLEVISGYDPADPITAKATDRRPDSYVSALRQDGLAGKRIGVLTALTEDPRADPRVLRLFDAALEELRRQGAEILTGVEIDALKEAQSQLWKNTFRTDLDRYLTQLGPAAPRSSLRAIVESGLFHESISQRMRRGLEAPELRELAKPSSADPADDPVRWAFLQSVLRVMDEQRLDAIAYPTWNNPPRLVSDRTSPHGNNSFYLAPHTGQPAITVPMGYVNDRWPAGLQLVARPFEEVLLLNLAYAYEQATRHRQPPSYFPDLPGSGSEDSGSYATEWISLFNGKDLQGWTSKIAGYPLGENFGHTFRVEDGLLKVRYDAYPTFEGRFGHLFFEQPFASYELRVEYRFVGEQTAGAPEWAFRNSGLMLHCQPPETMTQDQEFPVSIEVQLLGGDVEGQRPTANLCTPGTHVVFNGELLRRHCTSSSAETFRGDEWVTVEVVVRGNESIVHRVGGRSVLEYQHPQLDDSDPHARALLNAGDPMLYGGFVSIQSESHPIDFRRIEIRPLND